MKDQNDNGFFFLGITNLCTMGEGVNLETSNPLIDIIMFVDYATTKKMIKRKLRTEEIALITYMIKDTLEGKDIISKLGDLIVEEMDDGGMGSLKVSVEGEDRRRTGGVLKDMDFHDVDGMLLVISVILDTEDNFYELDVFKGDFSPLKRFPKVPE